MDSKGVVQIMMESFGADLIEQLRRNLGDAFQAVSGENLDWGALLVQVLGQLLVSVIYLGVFLGVYLILIAAIRLGLGERRTKTPLYIQMRSGLRYLAGLGALVVILAQFGVSPEVLKAMARAGFMVLGFYVVWVVFRRLIKEGTSRYRMDPAIRQLV